MDAWMLAGLDQIGSGWLLDRRLGCLDAWMLAGLDWIGSEWLLDRRKWLDGVDGRRSHTLELRGARRIRCLEGLQEGLLTRKLAGLKGGAVGPLERLQDSKIRCLDAWMPGCWQGWILDWKCVAAR